MSKNNHVNGAAKVLQSTDPALQTALQVLLGTDTVTESICNWNAARYDQEPSHELTVGLLREEVLETLKAFAEGNHIAVLDGYADVFFVAIGALWKTGLRAEHIDQLMDSISLHNSLIPSPQVALIWYEDTADNNILGLVALAALQRLEYLLNDENLALDAIRAVCISNNTKDAEKTPSHIKANTVKGTGYVPPTKALTEILERSNNARK